LPDSHARADGPPWEPYIVHRAEDRIVTQRSRVVDGTRVWGPAVSLFPADNPPWWNLSPARVGLPPVPRKWQPVEGVREVDLGPAGLKRCKELLGDQGLVGAFVVGSNVLGNEHGLYDYVDHPAKYERLAEERVVRAEERFGRIMALDEDTRPDFLCVGGSGSLVFQTPEMFRRLALPAVKRVIELATAAGMPTHVHCCGPERELVRIMAQETTLTVVDPLEIPPMGDCDLAELKRSFGDRIVLKGNLHTTDVMLRGTVADVKAAAVKAIRDAGRGGRFILSTGDQCGRDTPDENLFAMVEAVEEYGGYDRRTGELTSLPPA
jgi:uroporphyrinogen decarboxylase